MSGHPGYPPVAYKNENNVIAGVGPELLELILAQLHIEVKNKSVGPWARVQYSAKYGDIDIIAGIYLNSERLQFLDFVATSFMPNPAVIFVKKGNAFPFNKFDDLKGRIGGAILGSKFSMEFDEFLLQNKNTVKLERVVLTKQNFKKLLINRIDYIPYGKYVGMLTLEELGIGDQIEILPKLLFEEFFYFAVSKKTSSQLKKHIPFIDNKIKQYKADGTIDKMINKHLKKYNAYVKKKKTDSKIKQQK